ncbi:MAG TPA: hypothetical protein GX510_00415 [Firmicutes bacterium]|nr:hypothetical protein [Candidatus Fermentithermobacillaceae bacterium]
MTLLSLPLALIVLTGFGVLLFKVSGRLSAGAVYEEQKREAYFCGEKAPASSSRPSGGKLHPEYRRFFATAFLFTIMEAGALLLGTIPKGHGPWLSLAFAGLMLLSLGVILVEVFQE